MSSVAAVNRAWKVLLSAFEASGALPEVLLGILEVMFQGFTTLLPQIIIFLFGMCSATPLRPRSDMEEPLPWTRLEDEAPAYLI